MIRFSNGHELTFACGSGALAFDGRGWPWEWPFRWVGLLNPKSFGTVVAKTVGVEPIKGNLSFFHPWSCVRLLWGKGHRGAVNAVGLTGPGIKKWVEEFYPIAKDKGYKLAASVMVKDSNEAEIMSGWLRPLDLAYVEWNDSCPNVDHGSGNSVSILKSLKKCDKPLVAKLAKHQIEEGYIRDIDPYVEAYHAINTVPWPEIFADRRSPIKKYRHGRDGGVSGTYILSIAVSSCYRLSKMTEKPIIGGGGIFSLEDVLHFERNGASAFSIGTCFMYYPWYPNRIAEAYHMRRFAVSPTDD